MADIADELITYLKTIKDVTDLVGSGVHARIYRYEAKQGVQLPYIIIETFEGTSAKHLNGITGIATNRAQVDCYGANTKKAYALAEAVRLAPLQEYRGMMGDTFVNNVNSEGSYEFGRDKPTQGGNRNRYWVSRDYILTYQEATQ